MFDRHMDTQDRQNGKPKLMFAIVLLLIGTKVCAQSFVKSAPILHDSVPIVLERASGSHGFPPLNTHCLCLAIPSDVEGKVLVEFTGGSDQGFASFYAYAKAGQMYACFTMRPLTLTGRELYYEGRRMWFVTLRRPPDKRFR